MYSCNFVIGSRCKKVRPFHFLSNKGYYLPSLIEIGPVVLEKIFKFSLFRNNLLLEEGGALHLNKITQGCFLLSMVEFWRGIFWNLSMYFHYFIVISPWKREGPLIWTNWILFTKEWFVQSLIEIGQVVLEKKIFKNVYFCNYVIISYWNRAGPSFKKFWIPFTQGWFVPSLAEIGPVVL